MKTNDKPTCDLETVITAQITIIDKEVVIGKDCVFADLAEALAGMLKEYFANISTTGVLDDERIKVQFFLHERSKGCE